MSVLAKHCNKIGKGSREEKKPAAKTIHRSHPYFLTKKKAMFFAEFAKAPKLIYKETRARAARSRSLYGILQSESH